MEMIRSKKNPHIKEWKKLLTTKGRRKSRQYLIEGTHLAEEALNWKVPVERWIMTQSYYITHAKDVGDRIPESKITLIEDYLAAEISSTIAPQGIFALVNIVERTFDVVKGAQRVLLLDRVQDPGNIGTMIRTADAAAYDAVIIGRGSADIYNDKVIRSTQGSLWHLPVIEGNLLEVIDLLKNEKVTILATALNDTAIPYDGFDLPAKSAIIVGNEGSGVEEKLIKSSDRVIFIPMPGSSESLNVGVAAGILMFHFIN